jgi:y4mF family transcriptional regulator
VFRGVEVLDRELHVDFLHREPIIKTVRQQKDPEREHSIGSLVRQRRISGSLTQQQLGELAGVGKRFVVDLEGGKATARLDRVNLVLAVFGKRVGVEDAPRQRPVPGDDDV